MCACTSDRLRYVAQDPEKEGFFINDSSGGIEYSLVRFVRACDTCEVQPVSGCAYRWSALLT